MQAITTTSGMSPNSYLWKLTQGLPLITSQGRELPRSLPFRKWDGETRRWEPVQALIAAIDNGNDAFKGAMLHKQTPTMTTKRILTAYTPARKLRGGEGVVTWQVNNSEEFGSAKMPLKAKRLRTCQLALPTSGSTMSATSPTWPPAWSNCSSSQVMASVTAMGTYWATGRANITCTPALVFPTKKLAWQVRQRKPAKPCA
jgi:hypothetical protein